MQFISGIIDFILHLDESLGTWIRDYGALTYLILFLIIFCETGLVVTPFLPGDSILFAAGAFAAVGAFDPYVLFGLLAVAAIGGDTANYWIGNRLRYLMKDSTHMRFVKREHLDRTAGFFERHGGKTIVLARFVPIIRTFAPFVAGAGRMRYRDFILYNIVGGVIWVGLFVVVGYFFGQLPFVRKNFSLIIIGMVLLSLIPIGYQAMKAFRGGKKAEIQE